MNVTKLIKLARRLPFDPGHMTKLLCDWDITNIGKHMNGKTNNEKHININGTHIKYHHN